MKILISEEEKSRILGMHKNATSRHYLGEAPTGTTPTVTTTTTKSLKPAYIGFNYGNITIGINYIVNQGIVTISGSESYADGTKKTLQGVSTAPEQIDNAVSEFLTRNGGIRGNLMVPGQTANFRETLKTKLTEMNTNVQNYKKTLPTQK
jgi:hypothetical protein